MLRPKQLQTVDQRDKDLINGYIKSCRLRITSPLLIENLCTMYTVEIEYFRAYNDANNEIILNNNKKIVKINQEDIDELELLYQKHIVYGFTQINLYKTGTIFEWIFKIKRTRHSDSNHITSTAFIGIASLESHYTFYGCGDSGRKYMEQITDKRHLSKNLIYGNGYKNNDIVKMTFNTKNQELIFHINNKDQGTAFNEINFTDNDIKYYMCIHLHIYDEIELISFKAQII